MTERSQPRYIISCGTGRRYSAVQQHGEAVRWAQNRVQHSCCALWPPGSAPRHATPRLRPAVLHL